MSGREGTLITLVFVALSAGGCRDRFVRPVGDEKVELTTERLIRGGYLVNQVCACGACHTPRTADGERADAPLAGGNTASAPGVGDQIWIPNLTPDVETGVGGWTDDELMRAIRDGVARDGRLLLPLMPYNAYGRMADEDVRAVVAYLRSVPPYRQRQRRPPARVGMVAKVLFTKLGVQMHAPARGVPLPDRRDPVRTGEYLATLGGCAECHALTKKGPRRPEDPRYFSGSEGPFSDPAVGKVWAPNLTPAPEGGLGRARPEAIKRALRAGVRLDGKPMAPPMAGRIPHLSGLAEEDLDALVTYLQSLRPVRGRVPERELAPGARRLDVRRPGGE